MIGGWSEGCKCGICYSSQSFFPSVFFFLNSSTTSLRVFRFTLCNCPQIIQFLIVFVQSFSLWLDTLWQTRKILCALAFLSFCSKSKSWLKQKALPWPLTSSKMQYAFLYFPFCGRVDLSGTFSATSVLSKCLAVSLLTFPFSLRFHSIFWW